MGDVTLPQVLHLQCGVLLTAKVPNAAGWLEKAMAAEKDDDKLLDALFLRTYSRLPTDRERSVVKGLRKDNTKREELFRDLFWALLNSKEFLFNR